MARILIVEDDPHFGAQLAELLEFHGHAPTLARTGPEGVERFRTARPELILLDAMLPDLHGVKVLEDLRRRPEGGDVPVLMMSAVYRNEAVFAQKLDDLGVLAFLVKPFSLLELAGRVEDILAQPEGGRAEVRAHLKAAASRVPGPAGSPARPGPLPTPAASPPPATPRPPASAADSPASSRPETEGEANPGRMVQLLTTWFTAHSSGRLQMATPDGGHLLYLLNGYPVWASVRPQSAGLPKWLRSSGTLDGASVDRLVAHCIATRTSPRAALLDLGLMDPVTLSASLEEWVRDETRRALAHRGRFRFDPGDAFAGDIPVYEVNPIRAAWVGARDDLPEAVIEADLAPLRDRQLGRTRSFNRLFSYIGRRGALRELAEKLQEERSLANLEEAFAAEAGLVRRCVWFLMNAGMLAVSDRHRPKQAPSRDERATRRAARMRARLEAAGVGATRDGTAIDQEPAERLQQARHAASGRPAAVVEAAILADYASRMGGDHYAFMGLPRDASKATIEARYLELAPRWRRRELPAEVGSDCRGKAKELLTRLVRAYDVLSQDDRRSEYDRRTAEGTTTTALRSVGPPREEQSFVAWVPESGDWSPAVADPARLDKRVRAMGEAGDALARAHRHVGDGDLKTALGLFEGLRRRHPSDAALLVDLGWCLHQRAPDSPDNTDKALEWLDLALAFKPGDRLAVEAKARILVDATRRDEALPLLEALAGQPGGHPWARQQLGPRRPR